MTLFTTKKSEFIQILTHRVDKSNILDSKTNKLKYLTLAINDRIPSLASSSDWHSKQMPARYETNKQSRIRARQMPCRPHCKITAEFTIS